MIISKTFLNSMARQQNIDEERGFQFENRLLFENRALYENKGYDIFLSHRYLDKKQVLALVYLFNQEGFSVYVDWLEDETLDRSNVTESTANMLRKRMKDSKCLAYLTTQNISDSKWCPWELGYFDGLKKSKCCILPIVETNTDFFNGQEYLGLYPHLEYANHSGYDIGCSFYICDKSRTKFIKLKDWLKGSQNYTTGILI